MCEGKEILRPIQLVVPLEVPDKDRHIESRDWYNVSYNDLDNRRAVTRDNATTNTVLQSSVRTRVSFVHDCQYFYLLSSSE